MEAHVIGFDMWVKAVEKVKSTDADKVIDALPGIEAKNLTGGTSKMLPNHHITKPVFIGEIKGNGQFDVVWKTPGLVRRRCLVEGARWLQGPDRRLGRQEVRQLQHQDQQVRRSGLLISADFRKLKLQENYQERPEKAAMPPPSPTLPPGSYCACQCSQPSSRGLAPVFLTAAFAVPALAGPFEDAVAKFANDDFSDTDEAVGVVATSGNPLAFPIISALQEGRLSADPEPRRFSSRAPTARSSMPPPALPSTSCRMAPPSSALTTACAAPWKPPSAA